MSEQKIFDFYKSSGAMTAVGRHASLIKDLPNDISELVRIVQGLAIHEYVASDFYGIKIPEQRKSESHIRSVEKALDCILEIDPSSLINPRPAEKRIVSICHRFVLLLTGILRAKGFPARARYGFGSYFNPPYFEEHIVCEYWNSKESSWLFADPQFDEIWRKQLKIDHDILNVPRDRFLIASDAWQKCRAGKADPTKFGIFAGDLRGFWFIAQELIHDFSALNKMEMLPWDQWGAMPKPNEKLNEEQLAFFDRLAQLTQIPDSSFEELCAMYENDERLHVPPTVFNSILNRPEKIM